jgi:hypothetical protein
MSRRRLHHDSTFGLVTLVGASLLASSAFAADVRIYSFATLDVLWSNQISSQVLTSLTPTTIMTSLGPGTSPAPSPTPPPGGGRGGGWPPSPQPDKPVYFQALDIDPHLEAELIGRQVALATYLTKSESYQADGVAAVNPDTASLPDLQAARARSDEQTRIHTLRQYATLTELFLIAMMRYYSVDTIAEKCAKIREAQDLLGQIAAAKVEADAIRDRPGNTLQLESRFAALELIEADVAQRYSSELSAPSACVVSPASSRSGDLEAAARQLEASLNDDLTNGGIVKTTLDAIKEVQQGFAAVQDDVSGIDPHTSTLLELELNASNAASNFSMVRSDSLEVQAKVVQMEQTVDVSAIANLGGMTTDQLRKIDNLGVLDAAMTRLSDALTTYLNLLIHLPETSGMQVPAGSLTRCAAISPVLLSSSNADTDPVTDCLTALKALVDSASQQTTFQLQMREFNSKVQAMSPEIIRDRRGY